MESESGEPEDIVERCFRFGVRVVKLCIYLYRRRDVPRHLVDQLADAGTSVGANVEEGQAAQSKPDFITKYSIALKEAREANYFFRLFMASEILTVEQGAELAGEAAQIAKILGKSVLTARRNLAASKPARAKVGG